MVGMGQKDSYVGFVHFPLTETDPFATTVDLPFQ